MIKKFTLILLFCVSMSLWAGRYAGDFIKIGSGVRALGMGGAFSAIANDGSAIYWNASGIAQIRDTEIDLMRAFLYKDLALYDNLSFCQPLPNEVTIGFNWTRLTIEDIPVFKEEHLVGTVDQRSAFPWLNLTGVPDDKFTSTDDLFQLAFAKHVHYDLNLGWLFYELPFDFYFGSNIKYIKRKILDHIGSGTGFDFSFITKTSLEVLLDIEWMGDISFALNFQDIGGTSITWDVESKHKDEILFNTKFGIAVFQPLEFIKSSIIISMDTDYVYETIQHYGLEFLYDKYLSFRLGYYDSNFSTGLSVKVYDISIDYAFLTNVLGSTNRVGLRINF